MSVFRNVIICSLIFNSAAEATTLLEAPVEEPPPFCARLLGTLEPRLSAPVTIDYMRLMAGVVKDPVRVMTELLERDEQAFMKIYNREILPKIGRTSNPNFEGVKQQLLKFLRSRHSTQQPLLPLIPLAEQYPEFLAWMTTLINQPNNVNRALEWLPHLKLASSELGVSIVLDSSILHPAQRHLVYGGLDKIIDQLEPIHKMIGPEIQDSHYSIVPAVAVELTPQSLNDQEREVRFHIPRTFSNELSNSDRIKIDTLAQKFANMGVGKKRGDEAGHLGADDMILAQVAWSSLEGNPTVFVTADWMITQPLEAAASNVLPEWQTKKSSITVTKKGEFYYRDSNHMLYEITVKEPFETKFYVANLIN